MHDTIQKYENSSAPEAHIVAVFKALAKRIEAFASFGGSVSPDALDQAVNRAVENALAPLEKALNGAVEAAVGAASETAWQSVVSRLAALENAVDSRLWALESKFHQLTPTPSGAVEGSQPRVGL